jgi:hypothetical protein
VKKKKQKKQRPDPEPRPLMVLLTRKEAERLLENEGTGWLRFVKDHGGKWHLVLVAVLPSDIATEDVT